MKRICKLYDMHAFLTKDVNFDWFPLKYMRYVHGMPVQTYEAILQNISTHLQLYEFAFDGCYNAHAISTLSNESFFSDLTCLDKESNNYPKACNVPHIMGNVVTLELL